MKKVDKAILKDTANKLLFDLNDESYDILLDELNFIVTEMDKASSFTELSNISPMVFPYEIEGQLKEDVAFTPLQREEVLKNASNIQDGQIRIPKVIK